MGEGTSQAGACREASGDDWAKTRKSRGKPRLAMVSEERPPGKVHCGLRLRHAALEGEKNQIGAAPDAEFTEEIGDMKFYGAFGDVEFAGDFFVGKILEKRVQDFLFAT